MKTNEVQVPVPWPVMLTGTAGPSPSTGSATTAGALPLPPASARSLSTLPPALPRISQTRSGIRINSPTRAPPPASTSPRRLRAGGGGVVGGAGRGDITSTVAWVDGLTGGAGVTGAGGGARVEFAARVQPPSGWPAWLIGDAGGAANGAGTGPAMWQKGASAS